MWSAARTVYGTIDVFRVLLFAPLFWVDVLSIVPFYADLVIRNQPVLECAGALALNTSMANETLSSMALASRCPPAELPQWMRFLQLLRLARILKLMRHYVVRRLESNSRPRALPAIAEGCTFESRARRTCAC